MLSDFEFRPSLSTSIFLRKGRHAVVEKLKKMKNVYGQRDIKKFYVEPWALMD